MRKCRYLVSFRNPSDQEKRRPSIALSLRSGLQHDLTLLAPSSYETAAAAPSRADNDDALFLLPRFGRGITAEVAVWPYQPTGKHGRWKVFVLARVKRTDDESWPEELTELKVSVILRDRSRSYGQYRKRISGDELKEFKEKGSTGVLLFPLDGIRPGVATVDLTVTGNVEEISANQSRALDIPRPPGPGEARPWFLSNRLDRMGDDIVHAPSFDDIVTPNESASLVGYGCPPQQQAPGSYTGSLVPSAGGPPIALPLTWLKRNDDSPRACGWLVGKIDSALKPGLWTFKSPVDLGGRDPSADVQFNVVPATALEGAIPEEAKP